MTNSQMPFSNSQTIKGAGEFVMKEFAAAVDKLKSCVTPIYIRHRDNKIYLNGSAVLIKLEERAFLCTALHVIETDEHSSLMLDGGVCPLLLEDVFHISKEHDVAVCALSKRCLQQLSGYIPLNVENLAGSDEMKSCGFVEFVGFPETKNRFRPGKNKVNKGIYSFGARVVSIDLARVVLKFNRRKKINVKTLKIVTAPDPHGMSGGAMFGSLKKMKQSGETPRQD